jgi:hypothetical protein
LGGEGGNPFTKKFKFFKKQNNIYIFIYLFIFIYKKIIYEEIKEGKKKS